MILSGQIETYEIQTMPVFVTVSVVENDDLILRFLHASALQTFAGRLAARAEQLSRLSLCFFVSLPPSLSLMCRLSQAGVGQAAMSISSIHQAVGRVAERG